MLSRISLVPSWMGRYFFFRGRVFRVSRTVSWRLASDVVCREITRPPDALASVGFLLIVFPVHGYRCFRMANSPIMSTTLLPGFSHR
jgi:hypothetical protein